MERAVTALVGDHPAAGCRGACDQGIEVPEGGSPEPKGNQAAEALRQQGQTKREHQTAPSLKPFDTEQLRRQAGQQLGLAGVGNLLGRKVVRRSQEIRAGGRRDQPAGQRDASDQLSCRTGKCSWEIERAERP